MLPCSLQTDKILRPHRDVKGMLSDKGSAEDKFKTIPIISANKSIIATSLEAASCSLLSSLPISVKSKKRESNKPPDVQKSSSSSSSSFPFPSSSSSSSLSSSSYSSSSSTLLSSSISSSPSRSELCQRILRFGRHRVAIIPICIRRDGKDHLSWFTNSCAKDATWTSLID